MSAGDDEVVVGRRLIAQRCLYGVDRNPMAVDLAKVSLWLATLAKEHPLTFVDHALRHGDSLVGLSQRQIEAFHWEDGRRSPAAGDRDHRTAQVRGAGGRAATADSEGGRDGFRLGPARLVGRGAVRARQSASVRGPRDRRVLRGEQAEEEERPSATSTRARYSPASSGATGTRSSTAAGKTRRWRRFTGRSSFRRCSIGRASVTSEHGSPSLGQSWGFDAIVGNPPFAGKELGGGRQRRGVSRLVEAGPRREPRQRRSRGSLFPSGVRPRP